MDKHCNGCGQKDRCQEVYEKLGQSKGPNIALRAVMAFVVPVAVFVAAAFAVGSLLEKTIENARLIILIQLAVGLAAAGVAVFSVRQLDRNKPSGHTECPEKEKY